MLRLVQMKTTGTYGYLAKGGYEMIRPIYTDYKALSEDYYALKTTSGWGFVNKDNKIVITFIYDNVLQTFDHGRAKVVLGERTIWIDKNGYQFSEEETKAKELKDRLATYSISNTTDENGLRLISRYSNGKNGYGYLDSGNVEVIHPFYQEYKPLSEGYYAMKSISWEFFDRKGKLVLPRGFHEILNNFQNGIAKVNYRGSIVWIDKKGNEVSVTDNEGTEIKTIKIVKTAEEIAEEIDKETKLKALATKRGYSTVGHTEDEDGLRLVLAYKHQEGRSLIGFIDSGGVEVIAPIFIEYKNPTEGYYALKDKVMGKWGFLDKRGDKMIDFLYYEVISTFKNGMAKVILDYPGDTLWIDKNGNQYKDENKTPLNTKTTYINTEPAVATSKSNIADFYNDGMAKYQQHNFKYAITAFSSAINANSENRAAWFQRAVAKYDMQDYRGAITDFDKVISLDPTSSAYYNRGLSKENVNDFKGAMEDVTSAISLNPKFAYAYSKRGYIKSITNDNIGAIEDYTKAILINPSHTNALFNRGNLQFRKDNNTQAISDYAKVVLLEPGNGAAWFSMAGCKFNQQNYPGAIKDYTKAIELKDNEYIPQAYYWRAKAKLLLNEKEGACLDLKMAASLGYTDANELISKNCK